MFPGPCHTSLNIYCRQDGSPNRLHGSPKRSKLDDVASYDECEGKKDESFILENILYRHIIPMFLGETFLNPAALQKVP